MSELYDYNVPTSIYISSGHITDQEIPTVMSVGLTNIADVKLPTVFIVETLDSREFDIPDTFECSENLGSVIDNLNEFVVYFTHNYTSNVHIESTAAATLAACDNIYNNCNVESTVDFSDDISNELLYLSAIKIVDSIWGELFLLSALNCFLNDVSTVFKINIGTLCGNRDINTTIEMINVERFVLNSTVFCSSISSFNNIMSDLLQGDGRVVHMVDDLFTTSQVNLSLSNDVLVSAILKLNLVSDLKTIVGNLYSVGSDFFNTESAILYMTTDIKVRSLFVTGFFIDESDFVAADSDRYVDIVDFLYPIINESIRVTVDGVLQSLTIVELNDNTKRVYFSQGSDFYSVEEININTYAENSIGEVLNEDFFLLYGYDVVPNKQLKFNANDHVVIRAEADNAAFCPNKEAVAFYFETAEYPSYDLTMSILPVDYVDLSMSIMPQSTEFFYGSTFTVILDGIKDFSGNIMPPFEYSFTIESY